ncbi:Inosine triphosphate pyrophosphatase [Aphelenchoides besseyi]|nr:Inosine triphosphate pyrophosphatase [Aphelenchoides besseyi]
MNNMSTITFVTCNDNKYKEAFKKVRKDNSNSGVIVEDTGFTFASWNETDFPGPYIKQALAAVGNVGLYGMLQNYDDKSAIAHCVFSHLALDWQETLNEVIYFEGKCAGSIVDCEERCSLYTSALG